MATTLRTGLMEYAYDARGLATYNDRSRLYIETAPEGVSTVACADELLNHPVFAPFRVALFQVRRKLSALYNALSR